MNVVQLLLKENPETLSYIDSFSPNKVILGDYFYATSSNIFSGDNMYSEEQIARILNLTDGEYAGIVHKLVNENLNQISADVSEADLELNKKLQDLELKVKSSRDVEEVQKRLKECEDEYEGLKKELLSVDDIQKKYEDTLKEYSKYSFLTRFNLAKIHSDLVEIIDQISRAEEDILNFKGEHIQNIKKETVYDKGKIGLALGWSISVGIICYLFFTFQVPINFIGVGAILGGFVTLLLLYTAKIEGDYPLMDQPKIVGMESRKRELDGFKSQKEGILRLVNVRSSDEFFHLKAQLGSFTKSLEYLKEQKVRVLQGKDFDLLTSKKLNLENEIIILKTKASKSGPLLKSEDYLATYREMDNLKLRLNQNNLNKGLNRPQQVEKLKSIRKELEAKLPGYKDLLKNSFKSSFTNIKQFLEKLTAKIPVSQIIIDEDGKGFTELSSWQKMLVEYAIVKEIYKKDFVFATEFLSKLDPLEVKSFKDFTQSEEASESRFYILDQKQNF